MSLHAVFFDLDDTLCDTIGAREARAQRAFQALARERPELDREEFIARVMQPIGDRVVRGVLVVVEELGLGGSEAGRAAINAWFFDGCMELLRAFEGVAETLDRLRRDYTLGVITNGNGKLQLAKCQGLSLGIELMVISGECGFEKPDPRIFAHACSLAGVAPRETVFVGDRLDVDIAGAKAMGMCAVWFNHWDGVLDGARPVPDAVIERFPELVDVLRLLAAPS